MLVRDFDVTYSRFWIQIHGLPLQFMNEENAIKIGGLFNKVLSCNKTTRKSIQGMKFMRIQVELDSTRPLPTGFF